MTWTSELTLSFSAWLEFSNPCSSWLYWASVLMPLALLAYLSVELSFFFVSLSWFLSLCLSLFHFFPLSRYLCLFPLSLALAHSASNSFPHLSLYLIALGYAWWYYLQSDLVNTLQRGWTTPSRRRAIWIVSANSVREAIDAVSYIGKQLVVFCLPTALNNWNNRMRLDLRCVGL